MFDDFDLTPQCEEFYNDEFYSRKHNSWEDYDWYDAHYDSTEVPISNEYLKYLLENM